MKHFKSRVAKSLTFKLISSIETEWKKLYKNINRHLNVRYDADGMFFPVNIDMDEYLKNLEKEIFAKFFWDFQLFEWGIYGETIAPAGFCKENGYHKEIVIDNVVNWYECCDEEGLDSSIWIDAYDHAKTFLESICLINERISSMLIY